MIIKSYASLAEAAEEVKCSPGQIIHFAATEVTHICVLAKNWHMDLFYRPNSESPWKKMDFPGGGAQRVIGPVRLLADDVRLLEADGEASTRHFGALLDDDTPDGDFQYVLCDEIGGKKQQDVRLSDCQLVVLASDLKAFRRWLEEPQKTVEAASDLDRPVGWRERTSLLVIISAIAKQAKLDLSHPSKAAAKIENWTTGLGCRVSQRAIEDHLKRIPEALERGGGND